MCRPLFTSPSLCCLDSRNLSPLKFCPTMASSHIRLQRAHSSSLFHLDDEISIMPSPLGHQIWEALGRPPPHEKEKGEDSSCPSFSEWGSRSTSEDTQLCRLPLSRLFDACKPQNPLEQQVCSFAFMESHILIHWAHHNPCIYHR